MCGIPYGLAEGLELLWGESHSNGFSSQLAGPLIAAAGSFKLGAIHYRALGDIIDLSQALTQAFIFLLPRDQRHSFHPQKVAGHPSV